MPETTVTAMLTGGTIGDSITVDLAIQEFEEGAGGHLGHTPLPAVLDRGFRQETGKGELVGGADVLQASCTAILADDPAGGGVPVGTCEVTYQAGIVSGTATIHGQVSGSDPIVEDTVDVRIAMLLSNVAGLFPRNQERFRSPTTAGKHPAAYFVAPEIVANILDFQRTWEELTVSTDHPNGTYVSLNDLSLPGGGLFDVNGDWVNVHNSHRLGTSMDVNRLSPGPFDVDTQVQVTPANAGAGVIVDPTAPDGVRLDRDVFRDACRVAGGFVVTEPSLHCDWRRTF